MSTIKVNNIQSRTGNAISFTSGDTITIHSGATFTNNGTITGLGANTPAFYVDQTANQQINDETYTVLQFNNVRLDTDSGYNTSNYQYTIPTTGKYFIYAMAYVYSPSNSTGLERYHLRLMKNSDDAIAESYYDQRNNPGYIFTNKISHIENLTANDTIYVHAFVDVTNNVADPEIGGSSSRSITSFGAYRLIGA